MLDAAGNAWSGMREATVDVMQYQYGNEVAAVAADSADVVEGVANMGVAMKYAQPSQVRTQLCVHCGLHVCYTVACHTIVFPVSLVLEEWPLQGQVRGDV
jgi:hypothetical protein